MQKIESGLSWKVQCQKCEANLGARGIKSLPDAKKWMATHAEKTGHTHFDMDVSGYTIFEEKPVAG